MVIWVFPGGSVVKIPPLNPGDSRSSILPWEIPWTEEPGELQSMGLQSDMTETEWLNTHARTTPLSSWHGVAVAWWLWDHRYSSPSTVPWRAKIADDSDFLLYWYGRKYSISQVKILDYNCGFVYFSLQFCFCFVYSEALSLMCKHLGLVCPLDRFTTLLFLSDFYFWSYSLFRDSICFYIK